MHILVLRCSSPTPFRAVWAQDINTISLSAAACPLQRQTSVDISGTSALTFCLHLHTDDQCGHTRRAHVHPDAQYPAQATFARTLTVEAKPALCPVLRLPHVCRDPSALSPLPGARTTLRAGPYGPPHNPIYATSNPCTVPVAALSQPPPCKTLNLTCTPSRSSGHRPAPASGTTCAVASNARRLPALAPRFAIAGVVSVYTPSSPSQTLTCSRSALSPSSAHTCPIANDRFSCARFSAL
ncbi:hypothetical protein B0H14DRAFT_3016560 [Mycena olivaceomarginata]|nr:hypothetical protein B0H14DRAFT_3016560 [Mycena olivaceomarginata]